MLATVPAPESISEQLGRHSGQSVTPEAARALTARLLAYWVAPPWVERPESASPPLWDKERIEALMGRFNEFSLAWQREGRARQGKWSSVPSLMDAREQAGAELRERLEQAFGTGLALRRWGYLFPSAVVKVELLDDWLVFGFLHSWRFLLDPEHRKPQLYGPQVDGWSVCRGCDLVFRAVRQRGAALYCRQCAKSPPVSGRLGMMRHERVDLDEVRGRIARGEESPRALRAVVMAPILAEDGRRHVTGWRSWSYGCCLGCGQEFGSDYASRLTCSDRCRKRWERIRRRALAGGPTAPPPGPSERPTQGSHHA